MVIDIERARAAFDRLTPTGTNKYIEVGDIAAAAEALGVRLGVADPVRQWADDDREGEVFNPGDGPMAGYRVGWCGHRVAGSEWRAGFRVCERDPVIEDDVRGWALSVAHLAAAVEAAGLALPNTDNRTLIPDGEFTNYARDWANGLAELEIVDSYVDWDAFANSLRQDFKYVGVEDGEFAGNWLVRA